MEILQILLYEFRVRQRERKDRVEKVHHSIATVGRYPDIYLDYFLFMTNDLKLSFGLNFVFRICSSVTLFLHKYCFY